MVKKKNLLDDPNKIKAWGGILCAIAIAGYLAIDTRNTAAENKRDIQDLKTIADYFYRKEQPQQQWQQEQRQQPNPYPQPPRRCYETWTDGFEYEVDCRTGEWINGT